MKRALHHYKKRCLQKLRPFLLFLEAMNKKNLGVMAAGIAYYTLLAVFPAMAAGMAVTLFILEPSQIETIMRGLGAYVPKEIVDMLIITLGRQAGQSSNLIMAGVSVAIALFGASGAIENTTKALNVMYDKRETRNPVRLRLLSIILTIGALLLVALVAILLLLTYGQLVFWGLPEWWALLLSLLRWPVMIVVINTAIMLLFRYGANRERSAWQVTTRGVAAATVLWLLVTAIFFAYLQHFAGFTRSYSIFAGIIALMIWFNLSAMTILTGALIDARRKKPDTRRSV